MDAMSQAEQHVEKLLGLWDVTWFGVDTPYDAVSSSHPKSGAYTADPLDNVVPVIGYEPFMDALQPSALSMPAVQHPQLLDQHQQPQQRAASTSTAVAGTHYQQQLQARQQLQSLGLGAAQSSASAAAPAAPIPAPAARSRRTLPSATEITAANRIADGNMASSRALMLLPAQPQPEQQQEQEPQALAPFVLGTWAQRQYIMPLKRPADDASTAAAAAGSGAAHPQKAPVLGAQSSNSCSPARPIPNGRLSSNGSSHSSGASTRGVKALLNGLHSSSGGSSEAVPAAAAQEAAAAAAAAEAAAVAEASGGGAAANGDDAAAAALWQAAAAAADSTAHGTAPVKVRQAEEEEDAVQQIAWRWRFARRWQAEQARGPQDPAAPASPAADGGMEEALQFLTACGENWHHLSRCGSHISTVESRLLGTLGSVGGLGAELLAEEGSFSVAACGYGMQAALLQDTADSGGLLAASCCSRDASRDTSRTGEPDCSSDGMHPLLPVPAQQQQQQQQAIMPAEQLPALQQQRPEAHGQHQRGRKGGALPRGEATVQVSGITRRAQQLLEKQNGISEAARERWREVSAQEGCGLWVGALLEAVQVDHWGKFKFLLLRLEDRGGRKMLLVRGSNSASEAAILDSTRKEMLLACSAHSVPPETLDVVGGGVMEWTQHRDRHLHISCGYVSRGSTPAGPSTATEVMRLAAVLTQQALPMHYKVTHEGGSRNL